MYHDSIAILNLQLSYSGENRELVIHLFRGISHTHVIGPHLSTIRFFKAVPVKWNLWKRNWQQWHSICNIHSIYEYHLGLCDIHIMWYMNITYEYHLGLIRLGFLNKPFVYLPDGRALKGNQPFSWRHFWGTYDFSKTSVKLDLHLLFLSRDLLCAIDFFCFTRTEPSPLLFTWHKTKKIDPKK